MADNTANHAYNRPPRGAQDWDVLLNENFSRIDGDVEIRDTEENRSQYTPKTGAKYLATDTGQVYIGDGNEWQRRASVNVVRNGFTRTADGTVIAPPGELQAAIDATATNSNFGQQPTQTISLVSGRTYEISDTITLKSGVRLDCNGARIVPSGDFNVFELHRETQLVRPHIDTRNMDWQSIQVLVGTRESDKLEPSNRAWVQDAYLLGEPGRGTGLQFRGQDGPCSMQAASGILNGFDTALEFYAAGGDTSGQGDWSNGNHFEGTIRNYRVAISMRSDGAAVSGNTVRAQVQANSKRSEWLLWMADDPRSDRDSENYLMKGNTLFVYPWDVNNYNANNPYSSDSDRRAPIWYLGRGTRYGNSIYDFSGLLGNEFIVNNSDNPDRNGIFTAHGGEVTGTTQLRFNPAYDRNDSRRWHPESENS
ncbi:hypothetical protein BVU17_16115 [Haloarcula taiwanensis]|uniref:Uncharacterized protein n=1 Tax=Haloarcula taiwanensis TaxID=1932004 RepID=A0A2H5A308_9EURY|nr:MULTISPECIES: hypothetical protein [Haloarcula]AUG49104.1 hypothetical protein BVU17_16115 [Haloarcula taiwanensis]RLM34465.1 hypothetical protein DVK01_12270 [Haloarcula sp. Atlit-120R]RLM95216.1 hypothetical protein D3D01_13855 [Haloarcula sp. Atlit-7R]